MKRGGKTFICLLGGIALTMGAKAITGDPTSVKHGEAANPITSTGTSSAGDSPYGAIVERNIFDLKDPPPPEAPKETNAPPPNVTLTGIMSILGKKQALFMVQKQAPPGKPGPPLSPESYIMMEGQRQDGLEVLEIDQKGSKVKIKNDGIVSTITFEVPKAGAGGQPAPGGMMNSQPHMGRPGFNPNMNNPNAGTTPLPTRQIRTPDFSQYSQGAANQGNPYNSGGAYSPQGAYNQGGISAVGYNQGFQGQQQQSPLTSEQQVALALAQQQQHAEDVSAGRFPSLPNMGGQNDQQPAASGAQQPAANSTPNNMPAWMRARLTGSAQLPPSLPTP